MATQLQLRRGTTTEHSTFVGAVGEVTVDTTKDTLVVHDGATTAGFPLAKESTVTALDSAAVHKTGDETVAGTKTLSSNPILSAGTANGVAYLNGSKALTTGSALTFDGTTLTAKSAKIADGNNGNLFFGPGSDYGFSVGIDNGGVRYNTPTGTTHQFRIAGSDGMRLTSTGLGIGTSSPSEKLEVVGVAKIRTGGGSGIQIVSATTPYIQAFGASGNNTLQLNGQSISFWSGSSYGAESEKMRLDSSGNLGLGVTPSAWARKAIQIGDAAEGYFASNTRTAVACNYFYDGSGKYIQNGYATLYESSSVNGAHSWFTAPSGTAGNAISFTQAMTLDASGNLIVGATSAGGVGATIYPSGIIRSNTSGTVFAQYQYSSSSMGTINTDGANISYNAQNALTFGTGGATERMRIDSSGSLLINTTSRQESEKLFVNGTTSSSAMAVQVGSDAWYGIRCQNSASTVVGGVIINTSSVQYATSSDYRLKENIQPMQNALGVVAQLNPVTYTWKADGSDGQGFIAHELQAVVPDCVTGEKDAVDAEGNPVYQGIDTSFLVATLTKAIQELKEELDATKAEVAALKGN